MTFDYAAWRARMRLTHQAACRALGISLRQSYYLSSGTYQPRQPTILACRALEVQKEGASA